MSKGDVPIIEDEEVAKKILAKYDVEWHGAHPTDASKKGKGWYTRMSGSGEKFTKTLVGMPRNV